MAIDNFKKIEDTKGYLVDDKDRQIFEREISKGYFGINMGDTIEFILYDSSNNPLPQESAKGKTVRYIEYNDNTKKEYFGKTQLNQKNIKSNQSEEFFVDVEKLIKEAGYSNGIFKSQISLLNRRLGSADRTNDTTWIHEISPSRTEIRILPTVDSDGKPNSDLEQRYECLVQGKTFVADVLPLLDEFVEQFDVQTALENMLTLKGTVESGQNYINLIIEEFKIQNFEVYLQNVKAKFVEAVNHYKNNREYNILSNNFGQPKSTTPQLCFGSNEIMDTVTNIIGNCIEYYLPKRNIQEETSLTIEQQETLDKVGEILKTVTSNKNYSSTIPPSISAGIPGCMDPNSKTYNPNATINVPDMCVYADTSENVVIDKPSETKIQIEPKPEIELDPPQPPKPMLCENPAALNYGLPGVCIFPLPKDDRPFEVFPTLEYDTSILIQDNGTTVVIPLGDRERNTTKSPNIFTDQRDINVRGIGFNDEVRMENIGGVAQIANTQTNDRIANAQQRLVGGTGDLSQVGGRTPGTSAVAPSDPNINRVVETGRGNFTANEQLAARERLLSGQKSTQPVTKVTAKTQTTKGREL
jgi:hypothetical protein